MDARPFTPDPLVAPRRATRTLSGLFYRHPSSFFPSSTTRKTVCTLSMANYSSNSTTLPTNSTKTKQQEKERERERKNRNGYETNRFLGTRWMSSRAISTSIRIRIRKRKFIIVHLRGDQKWRNRRWWGKKKKKEATAYLWTVVGLGMTWPAQKIFSWRIPRSVKTYTDTRNQTQLCCSKDDGLENVSRAGRPTIGL